MLRAKGHEALPQTLAPGVVRHWASDLSAATGPALARARPHRDDGLTLARGWSAEQAAAMALALAPEKPKLAHMAEPLVISPQAVSLRLRGASAPAVLATLADWEADLWARFQRC